MHEKVSLHVEKSLIIAVETVTHFSRSCGIRERRGLVLGHRTLKMINVSHYLLGSDPSERRAVNPDRVITHSS